jgi:hypothetical protein
VADDPVPPGILLDLEEHAQRVPRVELPDGTLGIPASALASFSGD